MTTLKPEQIEEGCLCEITRKEYDAARSAWKSAKKDYDGTEESANRIKDLEIVLRKAWAKWNVAPAICDKHREREEEPSNGKSQP